MTLCRRSCAIKRSGSTLSNVFSKIALSISGLSLHCNLGHHQVLQDRLQLSFLVRFGINANVLVVRCCCRCCCYNNNNSHGGLVYVADAIVVVDVGWFCCYVNNRPVFNEVNGSKSFNAERKNRKRWNNENIAFRLPLVARACLKFYF